jgi:glycosyltransferase involved in cell wall biosynthesis
MIVNPIITDNKSYDKPLVSILITCFNNQDVISDTIKSIQNQTYENFEVIIVNDGSTDKTNEVLNKFSLSDLRIKIFSPGRIGRAKALNEGLKNCKGKYIAINDADDFSLPFRIQKQVEWLELNHETGLLGTAKIVREKNIDTFEPVLINDLEIRKFFLVGQPIQHSSVMVRKELMNSIGGYDEKLPFLLDRDIFIRIAKLSKLHQLNEPLIILNRSDNQYFKNKYVGLDRMKLQTKMQLKALKLLGFNPIYYFPIILKYFYSILLNLKN